MGMTSAVSLSVPAARLVDKSTVAGPGWLAICVSIAIQWGAISATADTDTQFGAHWHDGRAELSGYQWRVTRYGQPRRGQAVLIFVTEPFSRLRQVKVEDASRRPDDTFEVFKLNMIRDFQTGIYDYNTMVSVFTSSDHFSPVKISFSSAEWCGHVYEQLQFSPHRVTSHLSSYFEDESSSSTLDWPNGAVTEDNLFILLRGLRGPYLRPGQKRSVRFLPSAFYRRLTHRPLGWDDAQIHRLARSQTVQVPAGAMTSIVYRVMIADGRSGTFFVEQAYPHRIVKWVWQMDSDNEKEMNGEAIDSGQLTGTARLSYWSLRHNGQEQYLKQLGLDSTRP